MDFKKRKEPVYYSDFWYDLTDGGYIKPEALLKDKGEARAVREAIELLQRFGDEAEEAGVIDGQ
jgi:hypothetical protein